MLKSLETDNDEDEHLPVKPNYKTHPKITTDLELSSRLSLKKCCDLLAKKYGNLFCVIILLFLQ